MNEASDDTQGNPHSQVIPDVNTDRASGNEHTNTGDSCHRHDTGKKCKPGIKLPNTPSQWKEANAYFHQAFFQELSAGIEDLDDFVRTIQEPFVPSIVSISILMHWLISSCICRRIVIGTSPQ